MQQEAAWNQAIADQAKDKWLKAMVAYAYLPSLDIDAQLAALSRYPIVRYAPSTFRSSWL